MAGFHAAKCGTEVRRRTPLLRHDRPPRESDGERTTSQGKGVGQRVGPVRGRPHEETSARVGEMVADRGAQKA
jgi:hypothetical protein